MKSRHELQRGEPSYGSDERKGQFRIRLRVAFAFVLIFFAILFARFFWMQVIRYDFFLQEARQNRISLIPVPPVRGEITDINGVALARNYSTFSLELIPNNLKQSVDETVELLRPFVEITEGDLRRFKKFREDMRPYDNIPLKLKLSDEEAAVLASELYRFPGVEINARTFREYPYGELTAHFVGYIGRISRKDQEAIEKKHYTTLYRGTTHIGKSGLESFYETQLHGAPSFQEVEKDAQGNVVRVLRTIPPKNGQTVKLAMDIRVQQEADRIMGNRRGAMVAVNPQTGGILAFVSKPSFDPNLFIDGIDTESWNKLNNDWQRPLINRVTQGLYPPGSTFKPFMAMAALDSGAITTGTMIYSPGTWSIPGSRHQFRDSKRSGHGTISLGRAIQVSSDTFFYQVGYRMGIDKISPRIAQFGLGQKTGIDLPNEYIGILPSREWKAKRFAKSSERVREWQTGDTVSVSIGQGYNTYTPLQMAFATAILSMNGTVYRPHLAQEIIDRERQQITIIEPNPDRKVNYHNEHFNFIKRSMQRVLQKEGTAAAIGKDLKYTMAGKTGTAQVVNIKQGGTYNKAALAEQHRDHAWFISFAPVEKPEIAVAVLLENGGWGASAAPLARQLTDFYLVTNRKAQEETEDNSSFRQPEKNNKKKGRI